LDFKKSKEYDILLLLATNFKVIVYREARHIFANNRPDLSFRTNKVVSLLPDCVDHREPRIQLLVEFSTTVREISIPNPAFHLILGIVNTQKD